MQVYNDELYHYGKKGMKWGKGTKVKMVSDGTNPFKKQSAPKKKTKKSIQEHKTTGAQHVGNVLKFLGANVLAANRNHQAMKISKMITPD